MLKSLTFIELIMLNGCALAAYIAATELVLTYKTKPPRRPPWPPKDEDDG